MKKRKRKTREERVTKRQKTENDTNGHPTWALLRYYYPKVLTLRQYLVWALKNSKKRQRRVLHYGVDSHTSTNADAQVIRLLDSIAIGTSHHAEVLDAEAIDKDITLFTQQRSGCSATITPAQGVFKQSEIVDFTLWQIFRRHHSYGRPAHLLANGFQKYASSMNGGDLVDVPGVPGVWSTGRNQHFEALKAHPWTALPSLLGRAAERIISDMLFQCGIFQPIEDSTNLSQLSGVPLCDLKAVSTVQSPSKEAVSGQPQFKRSDLSASSRGKERGLSDIRFVRNRMFYAKATFNSKEKIDFGLSRVHALNRYSEVDNQDQTKRLLKYIFPRQFGLHNAFTSEVDRWKDSNHPFKDYSFRDEEIDRADHQWRQNRQLDASAERPLPRRLRKRIVSLVSRLRKQHLKCSYRTLLEYYCPSPSLATSEGSLDKALSPAQVSAFCRNVVSKAFPDELWGTGGAKLYNKKILMRMIDKFVRLRRYETLSLHDVLQHFQIPEVSWLAPSNQNDERRMSRTDFMKRREIMAELLYYLFDSFLIPLIRANFYVTEWSEHRNQILFFRQDVWKAISDPALRSLKEKMLEPCNTTEVRKKLARRELGVNLVRMLPKEQGMRPIMNLRRQIQKLHYGKLKLSNSVNTTLTPAFSILNYEAALNPEILGSALFSVEDIYPRLQSFRAGLEERGLAGRPLYFAKVDVKACFDTIPQKRLLQLARTILGADSYRLTKYKRAKLVGGQQDSAPGFGARPSWKFLTKATSGDLEFDFAGEAVTDTEEGRTRTVYVDGGPQKSQHRTAIVKLLEDHVECNLLKIGKRFYRQKEGIPQGSIVSSLLCSYFYAELEREVLGFLHSGESVLLRLIDDFLVISTKQSVAERFMRLMHGGLPAFGVEVKAEKSRANFAVEIDGAVVPRLPMETDFPYCGNAINTLTLNLSKDKERRRKSNIADSVTVDYSKVPGQNFYRKTLNALKLHMQAMLMSTKYNGLSSVLSNLHHSFTEIAQKTYHYIRSLPTNKQPGSKLVIKTIDDLIKLACVLMKKRKSTKKDIWPYECSATNAQARWLACTAFVDVFRRRQTKHRDLLTWLEGQLAIPALRAQQKMLKGIV